jgi:hypothetical protein
MIKGIKTGRVSLTQSGFTETGRFAHGETSPFYRALFMAPSTRSLISSSLSLDCASNLSTSAG